MGYSKLTKLLVDEIDLESTCASSATRAGPLFYFKSTQELMVEHCNDRKGKSNHYLNYTKLSFLVVSSLWNVFILYILWRSWEDCLIGGSCRGVSLKCARRD